MFSSFFLTKIKILWSAFVNAYITFHLPFSIFFSLIFNQPFLIPSLFTSDPFSHSNSSLEEVSIIFSLSVELFLKFPLHHFSPFCFFGEKNVVCVSKRFCVAFMFWLLEWALKFRLVRLSTSAVCEYSVACSFGGFS